MRNILVPVDFGEASLRALDLGVKLAAKFDAKLTVIHAFHIPPAAYGYESLSWVADWANASRRDLEALTASTKRRHANTESRWVEDDPRLAIIDAAAELKADLIIAGTHGRGVVSRLLYGSVAARLVRTSPVPLITTSASAQEAEIDPGIRHILIATDFGEPAQRARSIACEIARRCDAGVTLLHVVPPSPRGPLPDGEATPAAAKLALEAELELTKTQASRVDSVLVHGDPRAEILNVARARNADLIAMGTHGRRGLSRLLLGSVAEAVARTATEPVLTTAAQDNQERAGTQ